METNKKTSNKFSPGVRARAVRMVQEHRGDHASRWAAIAAKIGCSGETLRNWVRQAERDAGVRPGATTDEPAVAASTQTKWPPANPGRLRSTCAGSAGDRATVEKQEPPCGKREPCATTNLDSKDGPSNLRH